MIILYELRDMKWVVTNDMLWSAKRDALDWVATAFKMAKKGYCPAQAKKAPAILLHVITDPSYYFSLN